MTDRNGAQQVARVLGVLQEARRVGAAMVGTEHVLIATMADPVVRSVTLGLGVDLRDVQKLVNEASAERNRGADAGFTPEAVAVLTTVSQRVAGLDLAERPSPAVMSRAFRHVIAGFLAEERDTAARRIVTELGMTKDAHRSVQVLLGEWQRRPPPGRRR